jgi:hypothetical protein
MFHKTKARSFLRKMSEHSVHTQLARERERKFRLISFYVFFLFFQSHVFSASVKVSSASYLSGGLGKKLLAKGSIRLGVRDGCASSISFDKK